MYRFFPDERGLNDGSAFLNKADAHHALKVLRLNLKDKITLIAQGQLFLCEIDMISDGSVRVKTIESLTSTEAKLKITLYQGLPKFEKMDLIVQKATELGVYRIVPVLMDRCIVKIDSKDALKKQERWAKIAREASKQSGRAMVPEISVPVPLRQCQFNEELLLVPWEEANGNSLKNIHNQFSSAGSAGVLIGPEGGITAQEIASIPFVAVTLGPRILRTETAGLCALSVMYALYGDLE